jgi:hypothetical protein
MFTGKNENINQRLIEIPEFKGQRIVSISTKIYTTGLKK